MKPLLRQNSGLALPITLLLVAFNVTVLIALFVYATTELSASRNAAGSASSRIMALNGIDLAGALIAANSTNNAYVSYQNITNISGPRLETKIANVVPKPDAVDASFQRQVTNPTALHSGFAASNEGVDLNYATRADPNSGYILPRTNPVSSNWRNLHTNMFQMKWVNVYKGPSSEPTNLIGRFAFWVDDESTKLNINFSGTTNNYDTNSFNNSGPIRTALFGPRGPKGANVGLGIEFDGFLWPLYMELGGVAGISRTNAFQIINRRGNPIWRSDDSASSTFSPYYSLMESRLGTLPPVPGGVAITNISQQSQLGFTATIYSREPEISYATGRPRFDMFTFAQEWANNPTRVAEATNGFLNALNDNYPRFQSKYSLPQFVAAIRSAATSFGSGSNAAVSFPYTPTGSETPNFNNRPLPLINETQIILKTRSDGATNIATLSASVELIFMSKTDDFNPSWSTANYLFDELYMKNSRFWGNSMTIPYSVNISFDPPLIIGTNSVGSMALQPDTNSWFFNAKNSTTTLKPYDTNLTGLLATLKGSIEFTSTNNAANISWKAGYIFNPNHQNYFFGVTTAASYSGKLYQTIANNVLGSPNFYTNNIYNANNTDEYVFWWNSLPSGVAGVRGDPRMGIHSSTFIYSGGEYTLGNSSIAETSAYLTNSLSETFTNANISDFERRTDLHEVNWNINPNTERLNASIGLINPPTTWQPGNFESDPLSPDITPPYTLFESDRGFNYSYGNFFLSSGVLGEIPITTFKSGQHLAWSTPRFWGDGRTNMGGITYPPDWLMLDCVHTAMFPPNTNKPFANYETNFVSYGRLNINGLKSYFQTPRGSSDRSDTTLDSLVIQARTKDFRDYDESVPSVNGSKDWRRILPSHASRTNLLNYVNDEVVRRGSVDDPFLTGFDFTAHLAGNTNSTLTNVSNWEFYTPGKTNTSDSRIESLVRSLQQRVTSRGFQFSVFSLGQSVQVVQSGSTYKTNVIGESYFQAVWERAPKHTMDGSITNASSGGAPPLRLLYMRELR